MKFKNVKTFNIKDEPVFDGEVCPFCNADLNYDNACIEIDRQFYDRIIESFYCPLCKTGWREVYIKTHEKTYLDKKKPLPHKGKKNE
jgi:uncharacterized protein with PIN domain